MESKEYVIYKAMLQLFLIFFYNKNFGELVFWENLSVNLKCFCCVGQFLKDATSPLGTICSCGMFVLSSDFQISKMSGKLYP